MTKQELAEELERKIASGEITPDEAENEYRDFVDGNEGRWGWGWER